MKFSKYLSKQLEAAAELGYHASVVPVIPVLRTTSEYYFQCNSHLSVVNHFVDFMRALRVIHVFYSVEHNHSATAINVLARLVGTSEFVQIARFEYNKYSYDF